MAAVINPIYPGFEWRQAFDLPAGFVQAGDRFRAEFRQAVSDQTPIASVSSLGDGISVADNRLTIILGRSKTARMETGSVVTGFVLIRDGSEAALGQIVKVPVANYATRATT